MSDPTDPGGVGAHAERGRTSTRVGDSGSPVGSPLTIVLALIAVVAGFLIFRSIDDSANGADFAQGDTTVPGATTPGSTTPGATTATTAATATSAPAQVTSGATVIVANASNISGSAGRMADELAAAGYTMTDEPTNDTSDEPLEESVVYYVTVPPEIQAVAQSVANDLGGLPVQPMPSPIPVDGGNIANATVLVMMGTDIADQTLEDLQAAGEPNVTAPAAAGATTTTAG